jgi:hypothetical protein
MNKIPISIVLIISLMGCALALDIENGVEMKPGEVAAERLFERGIGEPWVGGDSPYSSFSQYYWINEGPDSKKPKKHIEAPKKHEIKDEMPATVYFSYQMQAVPYSQYKTYPTYTGGNSLWIQGATSWTQYAQVPQGSGLSLLATSPTGGNGYLYEIYPDGKLSKNNFYFFPGSNQINFYADNIGQHILLFTIDGQVSSPIVIDVMPYVQPYIPPYQYPTPIQPIDLYGYGAIYSPTSYPIPTTGDSTVKIESQGMRGYQVFLDGNYIGTEGTGGDPLDGKFSFKVVGNQNHEVRVYDGQFNYPKTMFFDRGGTKIIKVEPGMAVYR